MGAKHGAFTDASVTDSCDIVVIGGGIGGLAVAALLSVQGRKVLLLEGTDELGGFQHRFEKDGFIIEPNFHFLQDAGPGRPVRELLRSLDITPEFQQLDPIAQFHFPDRTVTIGNDRTAFIAQLSTEFPHEKAGIDALFAVMREVYEAATRQQPSPLLMQYGADTMDAFLSRFVTDEKLKTIIGAWSAYFGYGSAQIAALAIIVFTEACWDGGIHQPVGGIGTLVRGLKQRIETSGGTVRTRAPVRRIIVGDGRVHGVELFDGSSIKADCVVSNADTGTTFADFLAGEPAAVESQKKLQTLQRFRSPFCVYLGLRSSDLRLHGRAAVHTVFDSYDLLAQDVAQLAGDIEHAPVSLGFPTHVNPGLAPEDHDIAILYTFVQNDRIDALLADTDAARTYAHRLVRQAERGIPGLGRQVAFMETSASATAQLYTARTKGAIGWEPTPQQLPAMPPNETPITGLYLAGQWTRSGGGINNVLASARIAASMIAASSADLIEAAR